MTKLQHRTQGQRILQNGFPILAANLSSRRCSMSEITPKLSLPLIQAAQAQKHVTHNEAIERLDLLAQLTVEEFDAIDPPASPSEGRTWTVGLGATGAWTGQDGLIASWRGGGWLFVTPKQGWRAWSKAADELRVYSGGSWIELPAGTPSLENLPGLGVNATSDLTNRLSLSSDAALFSHDGGGHQLKINKASASDTASLLYQSDWSGRAEMGLAGNEDFSIKVSPDGATFLEALVVDHATGRVSLPQTRQPASRPYPFRLHFRADKAWTAPTADPLDLDADRALGTGAEPADAWDTKGLFLKAGTHIEGITLAGQMSDAEVSDIDLRLVFQHGPWDGSWTGNAQTTRDVVLSSDSIGLTSGTALQGVTLAADYTVPQDGFAFLCLRAAASATMTADRHFIGVTTLDISV